MGIIGTRCRTLSTSLLLLSLCGLAACPPSDAPVASEVPSAKLLHTIGSFLSPSRIALRADGTLLVADGPRGQVVLLDRSGTRKGTISGVGHPLGVAVDGETIYVGDQRSGVVHIVKDGVVSGALGKPGDFKKPNAIAVSSQGEVHVVDSARPAIRVFSRDGTALRSYGEQLGFPTDIVIDEAQNEIVVSDFSGQQLAVFDLGGRLRRAISAPLNSKGDPVFFRPLGLGAGKNGELYVVDNGLSVVAALDHQGKLLQTFGYGDGNYWTGDLSIPIDAVSDGTQLYVSSNRSRRIHVFALKP